MSENRYQTRIEQVRKSDPKAAAVFDQVLEGGRQERPWLPMFSSDLDALDSLSRSEQDIYQLLFHLHRHECFDRLCRRITNESGVYFDAWGPFSLDEYKYFYKALNGREQKEFSQYLELRRRRTLEIETPERHSLGELGWAGFESLLEVTEDYSQQHRFLCSALEGKGQIEWVRSNETAIQQRLRDVEKILKGSSAKAILNKLSWKGGVKDLVGILDCMKEVGYHSWTDIEIGEHIEWSTETKNPGRQIADARRDLKGRDRKLDYDVLRRLIEELQKKLP